ncbi:hypothetical protein MES4922_370044 [Mesorhizobium ventifaucium]|uniref:Uncharacterized protein n=1 Tax=Mesorhizobium ventifaucium TaxID=666020 RepID=A0ABN8K3D3_9HYPH|nr:hypothetical protein MES4922_370044 [Mesorhizobium ventifaucium]
MPFGSTRRKAGNHPILPYTATWFEAGSGSRIVVALPRRKGMEGSILAVYQYQVSDFHH